MRLCRYSRGGEPRVGVVVEEDEVRDAGTSLYDLDVGGVQGRWDEMTLLAPIARPQKIVCVGLNYRDHAAETGATLPEQPLLFAKWANAIVDPGAPIVLPPASVSTWSTTRPSSAW